MDFLTELNLKTHNVASCCGSASSWVASSDKTRDSLSPTSGEKIASVQLAAPEDYESIMAAAQKSAQSWREVPAPKRGDIVRQLGDKLRKHKSALGSLVAYEMGKSKQEGDGEVQEMIDIADFAVGQSRMLYGKTMHSEREAHRMYEQWHPLGVVGVISAFNFPVAVWSWNAFIAAICGNTVIWKPSEKTPLCAIAVQHLCNEVMAENQLEGIFSLYLPAEQKDLDDFVDDTRLPLMSFTGSTATGRKVNERVARRFGRALLELGGNNAIILDREANLDLAIPAIVFGAVGTAGQRCTTTRRLLVPKEQLADIEARLVRAYEQVTIGDPLDEKNLMGPLIDEGAVNQFVAAVQAAREQGGEVLTGGARLDIPGCFVSPTVIRAQNHWPIVQQETFAPILYVIPYDTFDAALMMQNAVPQGLSSAVFTNSLQTAERFLSSAGSDCGIANVNIGTSGAEIGGAFGGEKETGGGREAGSDSWKQYMRRQTNTINWGADLPLAQGIRFSLD